MNKVKFTPKDIETECASNENIFKVSKRVGVKIPTACNGIGSCGLCRVQIVDGEECLNKQTPAEARHLGNVYHINKVRLSCQCKFIKEGEVVIKTNE